MLACRSVALGALCAIGGCASPPAPVARPVAPRPATGPGVRTLWQERFAEPHVDWVDPFGHSAQQIARVYTVEHGFLHARHDGAEDDAVPAIDFGRAFQHHPAPLEKVRALGWKWRVLRHPAVGDDAWLDVAASVYVVIKTPSLLFGGKGFKFAWLARPGARGTHQHGLLQVALRTEPATREWRTESVDLCALYRAEYGPCEGQHVLYVGVVTDADNTRSVAEADYTDFKLRAVP